MTPIAKAMAGYCEYIVVAAKKRGKQLFKYQKDCSTEDRYQGQEDTNASKEEKENILNCP